MIRFASRADLVHEILDGDHKHNLRGYQCPLCGRLLVRVVSPKLTPFSKAAELELPPGVALDVEADWGWNRSPGHREADHPPSCPIDGTSMVLLSR